MFRLWCKNRNYWEGDKWLVTHRGDVIEERTQRIMNPKTHILTRYTGSTDKNGLMIYIGDVVKAYKHNEEKFICEINERFGTIFFGNWTWTEFLNRFRRVEVIGNIFEHPEWREIFK